VRLPVQLGLFWETLRYARLTAINHPRPVYYDIWLEAMTGGRFRVRKYHILITLAIICMNEPKRNFRPSVWHCSVLNLFLEEL